MYKTIFNFSICKITIYLLFVVFLYKKDKYDNVCVASDGGE